MIKFDLYRIGENDWVLAITDEDGKALHKILYENIEVEEITNLALSLAKGDIATVNVNYSRSK
jgi:hypothetical protein